MKPAASRFHWPHALKEHFKSKRLEKKFSEKEKEGGACLTYMIVSRSISKPKSERDAQA